MSRYASNYNRVVLVPCELLGNLNLSQLSGLVMLHPYS
jgi:hypothetical protein